MLKALARAILFFFFFFYREGHREYEEGNGKSKGEVERGLAGEERRKATERESKLGENNQP